MVEQPRSWRIEQNDRQIVYVADPAADLYFDSASVATSAFRRHPAWKLALAFDGDVTVRPRRRPVLQGPGILIPPDISYSARTTGPRIALHIRVRHASRGMSRSPAVVDEKTCRRVIDCLDFDSGQPDIRAARRSLDALLGAVQPLDPRVLAALDLITQYDRIEDLARAVGLSPSRLRSICHNDLGIPLVRLRQWDRIRTSFAWLDQSPSVAAQRGGFADQSHFSRITRSLFGRPPSAFRGVPVQEERALLP